MRFDVLDGWRGVAAMMVAAYHFNALHHAYFLPFLRGGYLFVDFFFVLSGFVITHAYGGRLSSVKDAGVFILRRFGRVWPLHVAVLGAFAAVEGLRYLMAQMNGNANFQPFDTNGATPLADLPAHIALIHGPGFLPRMTWNYPSWSISAEFWTYIFFAAVTLAAPARWRQPVLWAFAFFSGAVLLEYSEHGMDVVQGLCLPRCVLGFVTGLLIFEARQHWSKIQLPAVARWEGPLLVLVALFISTVGTGPLSFAAPIVFAATVFVFSFEAGFVSRCLKKPAFQTLGRHSYSIYMVHVPLVSIINLALSLQQTKAGIDPFVVLAGGGRVLGGQSPYVFDIVFVAYLIALPILAGLTCRNVEDPGRRLFNGWSENLKNGSTHNISRPMAPEAATV